MNHRKRIAACLAGALCLSLSACGGPGAPAPTAAAPTSTPAPTAVLATPSPSPEPAETPVWPEEWTRLSSVDFTAYREEMSTEDYEALSGFFPVLLNGETFLWTYDLPMEEGAARKQPVEVNLEDLHDQLYGEEWLPTAPTEFGLDGFTLCDLDGDGEKELILLFPDLAGCYLVLRREENAFYGVILYYRWFEGLQENGVFIASGGAATNYYVRLHFEDGTFWQELLGRTDWGPLYWIDEKEVTGEAFERWTEEIMVGDAAWYWLR